MLGEGSLKLISLYSPWQLSRLRALLAALAERCLIKRKSFLLMPFSRHCPTLLYVEGMLYSLGAKGRKGRNGGKVEVRVCLDR